MVNQAIRQAATSLTKDYKVEPKFAHWLAIQYINNNKVVRKYATMHQLKPLLSQKAYYDAQKFDDQIFETRLSFIEKTLASATEQLKSTQHVAITSKIDKVVTHPIFGLPIFVGIFLMFKLSFD